MQSRSTGQIDAVQRAYLLALCIPAVIVMLGLKAIRVAASSHSVGVLAGIDLFRSEAFLALGLSLGGLWILQALSGRWSRRIAMGVLQVVWVVVLTIEVGGHQFWTSTGSTLDFYLLSFSLENLAGNADVIGSEVPTWLEWVTPIGLAWLCAGPWLVKWGLRRAGFDKWSWTDKDIDPSSDRTVKRVLMGVLSLALLGGAVLPPLFTHSSSTGRSTTVNIALTGVSALQESLEQSHDVVSSTLATRLEPTGSSPAGQRRNVAFVLLESTRARSTTMYNPDLHTTPYLNRLADRSTLAERAYAVVPHTSKAMVASLCGVVPRLHMPVTEAVPGNLPAHCLAKLLGKVGYGSAFFDSAYKYFENTEGLVDNMGYDTFVSVDDMDTTGFQKVNYFGREDNVMLASSRRWLQDHKSRPFITTYLTLTPHHNYTPPDRYTHHDFADNDVVDRYLNCVNYADHFAHNLIEQYKELGLYKNTIFVFIGDHGEGFGEHGRRQHDNVIYQEGLHIPMIIHDPQHPQPRRIDLPVNQLDLLPTLVSMLGYDIVGGQYPGTNMYELDEVRRLRAHCWYERRCMADIYGDQKYIYHFGRQPDQFFDLAEDPLEKHNIAAQRDDIPERRQRLLDWRRHVNAVYRTHSEKTLGKYLYEDVPDIEHRVQASFGDHIELLGYDLSDQTAAPGQTITATYYFRTDAQIPDGWKLFVHGEGTGPFTNFDHTPVMGLYPVHDWQPGRIIADEHKVTVPSAWKPGHLDIYLGFWHDDKGRKPISGRVPTDGKRRAKVLSIDIAHE